MTEPGDPHEPQTAFSSADGQRNYRLPDGSDPLALLRRQYHWVIQQWASLETACVALASMVDLLPELRPLTPEKISLVRRLLGNQEFSLAPSEPGDPLDLDGIETLNQKAIRWASHDPVMRGLLLECSDAIEKLVAALRDARQRVQELEAENTSLWGGK